MKNSNITGAKAAKYYMKAVRHSLSCPRKLKRDMLTNLQSDVDTYLEENPGAAMEDLITRFGEPAVLSESYISSLDAGELAKAVSAAKRVRRIVLITCLIVLLLLVATFWKMIQDNEKSRMTVIKEELPVEETISLE